MFELDECLAVGGVLRFDAHFVPYAGNGVVLGLGFLQEVDSPLTKCVVLPIFAVSKQERQDGVDEDDVDGAVLERFGLFWRTFTKGVVFLPVI